MKIIKHQTFNIIILSSVELHWSTASNDTLHWNCTELHTSLALHRTAHLTGTALPRTAHIPGTALHRTAHNTGTPLPRTAHITGTALHRTPHFTGTALHRTTLLNAATVENSVQHKTAIWTANPINIYVMTVLLPIYIYIYLRGTRALSRRLPVRVAVLL